MAVAYIRVSTDAQQLSPEAQRADIVAWADRQGVRVASWHIDQGVSRKAGLEERPGLAEALAEITARHAGILAVQRRDRLGDRAATAIIEREVTRLGARVASADGAGNGIAPADRMMAGVLDSVAGYERELIGIRTRAALAAKRAKGERVSRHTPYGTRLAPDGVRLEPEPREQAVIDDVRRLRTAGMSLRAIAGELDARGTVGRTGRALAAVQIGRIMRRAVPVSL